MSTTYTPTGSSFSVTIPALSDNADVTKAFRDYHDTVDSYISTIQITTSNLVNSSVTTAKIADSAITSAKIADGTITTNDIADGAITSGKILDGTIATADIADSAITSAKIADGTIATADIADAAITNAKIADSAITSAKIADGTIVDADISSSAAIAQSKISGLSTSLGLLAPLASPALTGTATAVNITASGVITANGGITGAAAKNMTVASAYSGSTFAALNPRVVMTASTSSATAPTTRPDGTSLVAGDIWISW